MEQIPPMSSQQKAPLIKSSLGTIAAAIAISASSGYAQVNEKNIEDLPVRKEVAGTASLENLPTIKFSEQDIEQIKAKKNQVLTDLQKTFPDLGITIEVRTFALRNYEVNAEKVEEDAEYELTHTTINLKGKEIGVIGGNPLEILDQITEERIRFEIETRKQIEGMPKITENLEGVSVSTSQYASHMMRRLEMSYKDAVLTLKNGQTVPLKNFLPNTTAIEMYGVPFQDYIVSCIQDKGAGNDVRFISKTGEISVPRADMITQFDVFCR